MGTDIHFYTEVRQDDEWVTANIWKADKEYGYMEADEMYDSRCYSLFGILANVRNGSGFAGCDLGDGFKPIAEPRGIPKDACPEILQEWKDSGDHTPSWLLLSELLKYNWCMKTNQRGVLTVEEYVNYLHSYKYKYTEDKCPDNYCGGCSGQNIIYMTREQIDNLISVINADDMRDHDKAKYIFEELQKELPKGKSVYLSIEWETAYYLTVKEFLSTTIPKLLTLSQSDTFDDVRIVFWFDS